MTAHIVRFPSRITIAPDSSGGWLVLTPRRHGWLHGSLADARKDAAWLSKNLGIAVFEATTTSS